VCLLDYQNAHEYILDYIKTTFGSSLPAVVCRRTRVLFTLFVFVCV
jgi:F0F1-type ATP synthase membrane subunit a